jgi:hypothetical protein
MRTKYTTCNGDTVAARPISRPPAICRRNDRFVAALMRYSCSRFGRFVPMGKSPQKRYKEALEDPDIPGFVRDVLVKEQTHIAASHDKGKALRDVKK